MVLDYMDVTYLADQKSVCDWCLSKCGNSTFCGVWL